MGRIENRAVHEVAERARPEAPDAESSVRIRLFDADRTDRHLSLAEALKARLSARQLLWIDVEGELGAGDRRALADRFELDTATERALGERAAGPSVQLHGKHFQLRVAVEPSTDRRHAQAWLDMVAGPNVVISQHDGELGFLAEMNDRIAADASIGELDSAEFVASVLDAIVTTYHGAIDALEDELDEIDSRALAGRESSDLFARLVTIRRRLARLRQLLAAHRELFGAIGRPDFARGIESADPDVFLPVASRFEGAILSLESTRDVVMGSFDILMTRTAQRTNDVMRVLTLATVLALPATITAGFLGMNVIVPVPNDDPTSFWLIAGVVLLFEAAVIAVARWRHWI